MKSKRTLWGWIGGGALGFALCAALLGGSALAATGSSPTNLGQAFIDKLAQNLGISSADLQTRIKASGDSTVDDAVTSGQLTQAQGDQLKQRIDSGGGVFDFGRGFGRGGCGVDIDTLASTLGLTTADLRTQLEAGTKLTDIITAQGKTVDGVVTALVASAKTKLDASVTAGDMTQAQEDQLLTSLPARLTDMVNSGHIGHPHGQHGQHGGHDDDSNPNATPDSSATPDSGV